MEHNIRASSTVTRVALHILLVVASSHNTNAYPTLNKNLDVESEYGPKDRFTEGTMIQTLFTTIDLNNDQRLDEHEVYLYFQKQGMAVPESLWEKEDKNGDGIIEMREFVTGNGDVLNIEGEL